MPTFIEPPPTFLVVSFLFGIHALVGQDADIRRRRAVFGIVGKAAARADSQALAVDLIGAGQRFDDERLFFPALRLGQVGAVDDVFTRPQSAMAKQLIYPDGKRRALATGKHYCRIVFDGNSSFEPVVSNMVLECKAPVNIMFADTKNIDGKAYGQMILQLPEDERAAKRALAYLETQNVHTEEVDANAAV